MKLKKYEMETIITFSEDTSEEADIFTYNAHYKRQLEKLAAEHPEEVRLHPCQHDDGSARYIVPRSWALASACSIRPPRKPSAAQLEALAKSRAIKAAQKEAEGKG